MGWTTPTDRSTLYTVSAVDWNIVEDNLTFLYGDTSWTSASGFTNSWSSLTGADIARFRLVGSMVTMQGAITGGTLSLAAFTLPAAYRPTGRVIFATNSNGAYGTFQITSAGVLTPTVGATTNVSIACTYSVL